MTFSWDWCFMNLVTLAVSSLAVCLRFKNLLWSSFTLHQHVQQLLPLTFHLSANLPSELCNIIYMCIFVCAGVCACVWERGLIIHKIQLNLLGGFRPLANITGDFIQCPPLNLHLLILYSYPWYHDFMHTELSLSLMKAIMKYYHLCPVYYKRSDLNSFNSPTSNTKLFVFLKGKFFLM